MFKIRKEQEDAFSKASLQRFVHELALELQQEYPNRCKKQFDADGASFAMESFPMESVTQAEAFGIEEQADVADFTHCYFVLGDDFLLDGDLGCQPILADDSISGSAKMLLISRIISSEQISDSLPE